jgi:hypothetical protein
LKIAFSLKPVGIVSYTGMINDSTQSAQNYWQTSPESYSINSHVSARERFMFRQFHLGEPEIPPDKPPETPPPDVPPGVPPGNPEELPDEIPQEIPSEEPIEIPPGYPPEL